MRRGPAPPAVRSAYATADTIGVCVAAYATADTNGVCAAAYATAGTVAVRNDRMPRAW